MHVCGFCGRSGRVIRQSFPLHHAKYLINSHRMRYKSSLTENFSLFAGKYDGIKRGGVQGIYSMYVCVFKEVNLQSPKRPGNSLVCIELTDYSRKII